MSKKSVSEAAVKRPWCMITDMDQYLFGEGTHYEIYKKLGAHPTEYNGEQGVYFAVWAPHAKGARSWGIQLLGKRRISYETSGPIGNLRSVYSGTPGRQYV